VNSREFQARLLRRSRRAGVVLPPELGRKLEIYYRLLATWNQKINLTGLNLADPTPEALDRLLVEPLVAARHVSAGSGLRLIDVGSGGGSPAIPFSLALSDSKLLLVESKTRKSVFLREALRALEMNGSDVVTARFEELLSKPDLHEAHDILTVRAVRIEARVLMGLQAFVKPGGRMLLFRSAAGPDPSEALTPPLMWKATFPLVESLRSRLIVIEKRATHR
jgi:16S rRNA (guanine527-N7)-methyltransferase